MRNTETLTQCLFEQVKTTPNEELNFSLDGSEAGIPVSLDGCLEPQLYRPLPEFRRIEWDVKEFRPLTHF